MSRIAQLEKLYAVDPADADVMYMLAQEHARAGDHGRAVEWYDKCLDADGAYHYAYFHKARSREAAGDKPGAAATLRAGLARARGAGDAKAAGEIEGYLESLEA